MGLDDFLCANSPEALKKLPRLALKHQVFSRTAEWWKGWRKKKSEEAVPAGDPVALLAQGETVRVLHPAQDAGEGVLSYGIPVGETLVIITSRREAFRADQLPAGLALRHADPGPSSISREAMLRWLAFNASPVTTFPTEAQLYRAAARTGAAQLFDEVETLKGDKDRFEALIAVLNVGFEKGGVVSRLEKRGEKFVEVGYEVYAPRVLAGLSGLKDTLEDRAIPVFMLRKRREEPVARLTQAVEAEAQQLRDQCALACLTRIGDILTAYDAAPTLLEKEAIDDRAVDLWLPLVALTLVADAETGSEGDRTVRLLALARDLAGVRDADQEAGTTARLLDALDKIREEVGEVLTPTELLHALKARPGWDWLKSPRPLAGLLNPLGLFRQQRREGERRRWCYVLTAETLADRRARYGVPAEAGPEA